MIGQDFHNNFADTLVTKFTGWKTFLKTLARNVPKN